MSAEENDGEVSSPPFRPFDEFVENYFTRDARWETEGTDFKEFLNGQLFARPGILGSMFADQSFNSFGSKGFFGSGVISSLNIVSSPQLIGVQVESKNENEDNMVGLEL